VLTGLSRGGADTALLGSNGFDGFGVGTFGIFNPLTIDMLRSAILAVNSFEPHRRPVLTHLNPVLNDTLVLLYVALEERTYEKNWSDSDPQNRQYLLAQPHHHPDSPAQDYPLRNFACRSAV
jgi:hypothetical protein